MRDNFDSVAAEVGTAGRMESYASFNSVADEGE